MSASHSNRNDQLSFSSLGLDAKLLKALENCNYVHPTPIQQRAIPVALKGKDIIATSQTGSGKTAAFVLPILQCLLTLKSDERKAAPRALILSPTRELAQQISTVIYHYSKFINVNVCNIVGGMSYHVQMRQLKKGNIDVVVATPGRLIDYLERKQLNLGKVEVMVLDEADRMLDMGFIDDVEYIASATPKNRQTLLFTATLGDRLTRLARNILNQPERIEVLGQKVTLENIAQHVHITDNVAHKNKLLQHILTTPDCYKAIIFSATKRNAEDLANHLLDCGFKASALHGDMKQSKRNKTVSQLREGRCDILVATDVAARGIDINDISHVINYDMPKFAEDYVHRIGRTGRAGKAGIAISLVSANDTLHLKRIERFTKQTIAYRTVTGLEPKQTPHNTPHSAKPKPKFNSRNKASRNHQEKFSKPGSRGFAKQGNRGFAKQGKKRVRNKDRSRLG